MEDLQTFILRHQDGERAVLPHPRGLLSMIVEHFEHTFHSTTSDQFQPFGQIVLGMYRVIRISEELFNPGDREI